MLEQRLRSGDIVAFDGRILEVFAASGESARLHVARLEPVRDDEPDGGSTLTFRGTGVGVRFAREEAPACARLLAAISDSRRAYA